MNCLIQRPTNLSWLVQLKFIALMTLISTIVGCAPESSGGKKSSNNVPVQTNPERPGPALPALPASNHPLGGWWIGRGQVYDSTGWVSQCSSITLGLVVNTESPTIAAAATGVTIEKFDYTCDHGPIRWGRVQLKLGAGGKLSVNQSEVGILTDSRLQFALESPNGHRYSFELNRSGDRAEFMDIREYPTENQLVITDGTLNRVRN